MQVGCQFMNCTMPGLTSRTSYYAGSYYGGKGGEKMNISLTKEAVDLLKTMQSTKADAFRVYISGYT